VTEESTRAEAAREVGPQTESLTRYNPAEVPSWAVWVNPHLRVAWTVRPTLPGQPMFVGAMSGPPP